jgi:predicted RND superfamily exporter protein
MAFFEIFRHLYIFLSKRRTALFICAGLITALSIFYLTKIRLSEDIRSLLPDNNSDFLQQFNLLKKNPFMHKVIINLKAGSIEDKEHLMDYADELEKGMRNPAISLVLLQGLLKNTEIDILSFIINYAH